MREDGDAMGLYHGDRIHGCRFIVFDEEGDGVASEIYATAQEAARRVPETRHVFQTLRTCTGTAEAEPYTFTEWVDDDLKDILSTETTGRSDVLPCEGTNAS